MEAVIEFIFLMIFQIPGAFIRWLFTGCKKPLKKHIFKGDAYVDGVIGLAAFVLIGLFIRYVFF